MDFTYLLLHKDFYNLFYQHLLCNGHGELKKLYILKSSTKTKKAFVLSITTTNKIKLN